MNSVKNYFCLQNQLNYKQFEFSFFHDQVYERICYKNKTLAFTCFKFIFFLKRNEWTTYARGNFLIIQTLKYRVKHAMT